jgi:hypothetical protein
MSKSVTQRELARRLLRLRGALDRNIENLNRGGCAVFALYAAQALRAAGVEAVEIVLPDQHCDGDSSPAAALAAGWALREMENGHVGVRYVLRGKTYCMDSTRVSLGASKFGRWRDDASQRVQKALMRNGAHHVKLSYPFGRGLTPAQFAPVTKLRGYWNTAFDRDQIPKLRALIQAYIVHGVT